MKLSDAFIRPLAYVRLFLNTPSTDAGALRQRLEQQLSEAVLTATDRGFDRADIESGLFAVIAWIDETVMCSEWEGAHAWRRSPLQKNYFNTTRAGVEIFDRLNALRLDQNIVREVFLLCLAMGFKGRLGENGERFALDEIKARHLKILLDRDAVLERNFVLFPETAMQAKTRPRRRRRWPSRATILMFVAPLGVLILLYVAFYVVLSSQVNDVIQAVQ